MSVITRPFTSSLFSQFLFNTEPQLSPKLNTTQLHTNGTPQTPPHSRHPHSNTLECIEDVPDEAMDTTPSTGKGRKETEKRPEATPTFQLTPAEGESAEVLRSMAAEVANDAEDYTIATHFVKVRRSGTLADVHTLWELVGTEAVSGSLEALLDSRPGFDRLASMAAFDKVRGHPVLAFGVCMHCTVQLVCFLTQH